jgi:hypothetical protein
MSSMNKATDGTHQILSLLKQKFPDDTEFKKSEIVEAAESLGLTGKHFYPSLMTADFRIRNGVYDMSGAFEGAQLSVVPTPVQEPNVVTPVKPMGNIQSIVNQAKHLASKDDVFVPWGAFKDVKQIVKSGMFYPTYIAGLSGNGKTFMIEQACAQTKREFIRVQINPETDEDDLLGGFRLIDGETVFAKGPVLKAMENGAVLLLDEVDRATNKIMCLQGILEGKPVLVKKTGDVVTPAKGFTVIATANTKGSGNGDDDHKFSAASILDDAFLERFTIVINQEFPSQSIEKKIVLKHMEKFGYSDVEFAENLAKWSDVIRRTYADDGVDELISTRRLCHIAQTYSIFKDKLKSVQLCINRFDPENAEAFLELYTKVDAGILEEVTEENPQVVENTEV